MDPYQTIVQEFGKDEEAPCFIMFLPRKSWGLMHSQQTEHRNWPACSLLNGPKRFGSYRVEDLIWTWTAGHIDALFTQVKGPGSTGSLDL